MMNNEDFDRKMEFILNQQAQFTADIQQIKESIEQLQESQSQTLTAVAQTAETVSRLASVTHDGFEKTFAGFKNVNAKIDTLANSQILTDEKLRILITTVDRQINEGHNSA